MINKQFVCLLVASLTLMLAGCGEKPDAMNKEVKMKRPNVLFIAVDDLNDWIKPMGGHPQAITPNISRFADEGVLFARNYCMSPGCGPSRASLLTGIASYHSGLYSNYQYFREVMPDAVTLPEYFSGHVWVVTGYKTTRQCPSGNVYSWLYMNRGWGGDWNGYYAVGIFVSNFLKFKKNEIRNNQQA